MLMCAVLPTGRVLPGGGGCPRECVYHRAYEPCASWRGCRGGFGLSRPNPGCVVVCCMLAWLLGCLRTAGSTARGWRLRAWPWTAHILSANVLTSMSRWSFCSNDCTLFISLMTSGAQQRACSALRLQSCAASHFTLCEQASRHRWIKLQARTSPISSSSNMPRRSINVVALRLRSRSLAPPSIMIALVAFESFHFAA